MRLCEKGILSMPLVNEDQGYPKKPFITGWTELERTKETVENMPWERATGLGIILGRQSSNQAVLDIDDQGLARSSAGIF